LIFIFILATNWMGLILQGRHDPVGQRNAEGFRVRQTPSPWLRQALIGRYAQ
jgi:hypothetical protein